MEFLETLLEVGELVAPDEGHTGSDALSGDGTDVKGDGTDAVAVSLY